MGGLTRLPYAWKTTGRTIYGVSMAVDLGTATAQITVSAHDAASARKIADLVQGRCARPERRTRIRTARQDRGPCHHAAVIDDADAPHERGPRTLGEMADLVGDRGHRDNPRRWNRLVDAWLADLVVLEQSEEGRATVAAMTADPRPAVRLWSAAAVLFWDEDAARPTLAEIRDSPTRYDLHAITAKHTLLDFDAGRLVRGERLPGT